MSARYLMLVLAALLASVAARGESDPREKSAPSASEYQGESVAFDVARDPIPPRIGASWVRAGETDRGEVFVEETTAAWDGANGVRVWVIANLSEAERAVRYAREASEALIARFDCGNGESNIYYRSGFSEKDGKGNIVRTYATGTIPFSVDGAQNYVVAKKLACTYTNEKHIDPAIAAAIGPVASAQEAAKSDTGEAEQSAQRAASLWPASNWPAFLGLIVMVVLLILGTCRAASSEKSEEKRDDRSPPSQQDRNATD